MTAGRDYLIEHLRPADGSNTDRDRSTQGLVNPPVHNPTRNERVLAWVQRRAAADLTAPPGEPASQDREGAR